MPEPSNPQQASDRVSEEYAKKIISEIENYSKHEDFRKKVKEIVEDCTDSVPFMKKVQTYAEDQIQKSTYQNIKFWSTVVILPITLSILTTIILKALKLI